MVTMKGEKTMGKPMYPYQEPQNNDLVNFAKTLRAVVENIENNEDAANQVWELLPSCQAAQKYHPGQYWRYRPGIMEILIETRKFIVDETHPTQNDLDECPWYQCPCGKEHTDV